jgi:hypothetical protein
MSQSGRLNFGAQSGRPVSGITAGAESDEDLSCPLAASNLCRPSSAPLPFS